VLLKQYSSVISIKQLTYQKFLNTGTIP